MVLTRGSEDLVIRIEIFNLSTQARRLRLLLPFSRSSVSATFVTHPDNISQLENPFSFYSHDPAAERISVIRFFANHHHFTVVISALQILKLMPSSNEDFRTLDWSEWGPTSTRWFHDGNSTSDSSVCGSWVYFSAGTQPPPEINRISPNHRSIAEVLFCDFNPRIIRHHGKRMVMDKSSEQPEEEAEKANKKLGGVLKEEWNKNSTCDNLRLLATHLITDEWVLPVSEFGGSILAIDVVSRLPFRAFVRKDLDGWAEVPRMGSSPFAVFGIFDESEVSTFVSSNYMSTN